MPKLISTIFNSIVCYYLPVDFSCLVKCSFHCPPVLIDRSHLLLRSNKGLRRYIEYKCTQQVLWWVFYALSTAVGQRILDLCKFL
jgi:hypothetical protein